MTATPAGADEVRYSAQTTIGPGDPIRVLAWARLEGLLVGPIALSVTWPLVLLTALFAALGWLIALIVFAVGLVGWLAWWLWATVRTWRVVRRADSVGTFEQLDVLDDALVLRLNNAVDRLGFEQLRQVYRFGAVLVVSTRPAAPGGARTMYWPARLLPRAGRVFVRARIGRRAASPTP